MKKFYSRLIKTKAFLRQNLNPKVWLFVHLSIPALLGLSVFFAGPVGINTLLMDMLPQSGQAREAALADKILGEKNGREAVILAAANSFESAKKGASFLYEEFEQSPLVENISFFFDSSIIADFAEYFNKHRFVIADEETLGLLETGRAEEIAYNALVSAYGAFNFIPLDNIEKDPFLLAERRIQTFLSSSVGAGGNLSLKDDVLSACIDGTWYVMLRMTLAPQAVSISGGKNAVKEIYSAAAAITEASKESAFYFSGVPFHSYESSSSAQREISIISTIAMILTLFIFLYIFRSPLPVIFSISAVTVSLGMATAACLLIFREVHVLTFVFGTTLIGMCADYSIHFFIKWKGNSLFKNGYEVRSSISKSITVCFISTQICFFVFLLAPFPLLKQFAVFSMTGLLSSFLTTLCIYPRLKMPQDSKRRLDFFSGKLFLMMKKISFKPAVKYSLTAVLAVFGLAVVFFHPQKIRIKNDISSLYTPSASMLESEKRAAIVLDRGASSFWYFIVSGASIEETLQNEERLMLRLKEETAKDNRGFSEAQGSFMGTSVFVPSIKKQEETYEAMKALLPLAGEQYENLGFPLNYTQLFYDEFADGKTFCLPENAPAGMGISNLWIGKAGDNYYSAVIPFQAGDEKTFRAIADDFDFVHFINKAQDISRDLDTLTKTIIIFFLAAYLIVSVLVFILYPWRDGLKICAIPFFLILYVLTALTLKQIPLGFFSIAGLITVFGLGLDFIIYMTGQKHGNINETNLTTLAVTMSFLTSFLSFGALAFSNFVPVHIFGLTVSAGLSAAFVSALLLGGKQD